MANKIKPFRRIAALLLSFSLLAALLTITTPAVYAEGYDDNHCLIIVGEPDQGNEYVGYHHGGADVSVDQLTWVDDGVHGKAVSLDGTSDYLSVGPEPLAVGQMTFATWINFRGSVDAENPAGAYWQRLFTMSAGESRYFTLSPHAQDPDKVKDGGQLDGLYMAYYRENDEAGGEPFSLEAFTGALPGQSHFGLPQNEWHHVAVVADGQTAKVYIDGTLIFDEVLMTTPMQMNATQLLVGGGVWQDPFLNASLDDTMLFDIALSAEQVVSLMQNGNPADMSVTTTPTPYIPETPSTTIAPEVTTAPADQPETPFGLPMWGFTLCVVVLILLVVITIAVNLYEINRRRRYPMADESEQHPAKKNSTKRRDSRNQKKGRG